MNDLIYDDDSVAISDDDQSFKSALESPAIYESFMTYSLCVPKNNVKVGDDEAFQIEFDSNHSDFEDAMSNHNEEAGDGLIIAHAQNKNMNDIKTFQENSVENMNQKEIDENEMMDPRPTITTSVPESPISLLGVQSYDSSQQSSTRSAIRKKPVMKSMTFNQDSDCIAIATTHGFKIRTIDNENDRAHDSRHKAAHVHSLPVKGGIICLQLLHRTSLLAIVKNKSPRTLSLVHAKNGIIIKELSFTSAIRRVEMNRSCLVVLTAYGELQIFTIQQKSNTLVDPRHVDIVFFTKINILHESESARMMTADGALLQGSFYDLSPLVVDGCSWLITKSSDGLGHVSVYKITRGDEIQNPTISCMHKFQAHNHGICKIAVSGGAQKFSEMLFATSSLQGTVIRVFSVATGQKLYELQRGSSSCIIHSLAFNKERNILAVSGSKGTIHLFHLNEENMIDENENSTSERMGITTKIKRMLYKSESDVNRPVKSFVRIRLRGENSKKSNSITFLRSNNENNLCEENLAVCLQGGMLLQFGVTKNGQKRPTFVEDLMLEDVL